MTNSASCFSDIGVLSLDSENVQNISTPTSPQQVSAKTCQEGTSQSNGSRECRILNNIPNSKQMAVAEEDESHVQGWRHSNDINIVVYTETDTQSALQMNDERTSGGYAHELNRKDLSGMQMEVTNYALETSSWNGSHCEEGTTNEANKSSIVSTETNLTDVYHCDICGKIFLNKTRLTTHIEQHSNPLLKCTHCSYVTTSSKLLDYHQNIHTGKFKCKICNKLFTRKIYLTYHLKDIHCKTRHLRNCKECSARFMSLSGLKMHMQTVHEPLKTYSCALCNYIGNSPNCLASHMLRSHRKKYKCKICDYSSLTQGGLDKHERIYHNLDDRQFACKHCSYRGLKRRQLLDHERIVHSQDKNKHVCPVCKKSFRTQVLMRHHLPFHSDQHFYSCKGCSYTTRYRQTFHLHLKHSHPRESFKNLCSGPSEADFEAIISTALKTLEPFPTSDEQSLEKDYTVQDPENCPVVEHAGHLEDVPVLSEHSVSQSISYPSQERANCCGEGQGSQSVTLSEYKSPQQTETETSAELMERALVSEEAVDSACDLGTGNVESDQSVTIIDGSGLTSDEVQRVVGLAGDLSGGKQEVHHLVTLAGTDTEKSLFQIRGFNLEDSKIHEVVTLVNDFGSVSEVNRHTVTLLSNIMRHKAHEHSSVTHVSVTGNSDPSQENLVILPLGDAKVAIIQNDSFSNSYLVLPEQTTLLDVVSQQSDLIQKQAEKSIEQVTVYHVDQ